jgi:alanine racemase
MAGCPFAEAAGRRLSLPVIQTRDLAPGKTVGYGCSWTAARPTRLATVSAGYADGSSGRWSTGRGLWAGRHAPARLLAACRWT